MFILDSLFISGFRWVLDTVVTAAEAEMHDDSVLHEQLLAAEMRREMGEITDEEFADIEADLLARIREVKERREGGSGPVAMKRQPMQTSPDTQFAVEATVSGDFHETPPEPVALPARILGPGDSSGTVIEGTLVDSNKGRRATRAARTTRSRPAGPAKRARRTSRTKIR